MSGRAARACAPPGAVDGSTPPGAVDGGAPPGVAAWPAVSVVIPVRDEPDALAGALASVLAQDYPGAVEVVVADGSAGPETAALARRRFPSVRLVANPRAVTPAGLNRAVAAASHGIVARCDARCVLPAHYLRIAVETLARTGAAAVGGRQAPVGRTRFERAAAAAMTMRLGAGDARYRVGGAEGPADTVYLGVFRRAALDAVGGFDETLARNQDYELNWRLRARGGAVWFTPALAVAYRPRGSAAALARQYFAWGWWKRIVLARHPASCRWRQLAAPLLVAALAVSGAATAAGATVAAALPAGYALALAGAAAAGALRRRDGAVLLAPVALAAMHLAWGTGFWCAWAARRR